MIGTIMHFEEDVITYSWICIILHDHPMAENLQLLSEESTKIFGTLETR